ncbi:hypothetical protein TPAR_01397 [Tolypocladium paradoxum]|uniref:Uncharacterized protein n=1 Tax=Tolypocladium paradoxum TaxID=94208 RepID=A0A2S4L7L1_9HYPO|nr:hypothetical protein TPAR_01397 [Tolypocladium paradoxum]
MSPVVLVDQETMPWCTGTSRGSLCCCMLHRCRSRCSGGQEQRRHVHWRWLPMFQRASPYHLVSPCSSPRSPPPALDPGSSTTISSRGRESSRPGRRSAAAAGEKQEQGVAAAAAAAAAAASHPREQLHQHAASIASPHHIHASKRRGAGHHQHQQTFVVAAPQRQAVPSRIILRFTGAPETTNRQRRSHPRILQSQAGRL